MHASSLARCSRPSTTVHHGIAGTLERTLCVRHILPGRRAAVTRQIDRAVAAPTLASILYTRVVVVPASFQAGVDGHVDAIVEDLAREEASGGGLLDAGVACEVSVAFQMDGAS